MLALDLYEQAKDFSTKQLEELASEISFIEIEDLIDESFPCKEKFDFYASLFNMKLKAMWGDFINGQSNV